MRKMSNTLRRVIVIALIGASAAAAVTFGALLVAERNDERTYYHREYVVPVGITELQSSFRDISARLLPSVVTISAVQTQEQQPDIRPPWFDFFFGQPDENEGERPEFRSRGFGSGVIVERNGDTYYVITNAHVVGNAQEINILLVSDEEYEGEIVGSDPRKDLALVSFRSRQDIPVAPLGNSDTLYVGDWVLAIGSPFNFQSTVTAGIVSALGRRGGPQGNINDFIQTDAAINQGNSGGALINIDGEVIGINTWISSRTGTNIGLGFAIPINNVKKPIRDFIAQGSVEYGWLGISISSISEDIVDDLRLPDDKGALVLNVFSDSPADTGGILPGDFIVRINEGAIENSDELLLSVGDLPVGREASIDLYRQGERQNARVRITVRDTESNIADQNRNLWPGMRVVPLDEDIVERLDIDRQTRGVYIDGVEDRTPTAVAGLRVGDVITHVNDTPTENLIAFYTALNKRRRGRITFDFVRQDQSLSIGINR